jgi:hypothetical protein
VHLGRGARRPSGALDEARPHYVGTCWSGDPALIGEVWARDSMRHPTESGTLLSDDVIESERARLLRERLVNARGRHRKITRRAGGDDERLYAAARRTNDDRRTRSRRRRRKSKRRSSGQSDGGSSKSRSWSRLRDAPALDHPIRMTARRHPGTLYAEAYKEMGKRMGSRTGADSMKIVQAEVF